MQVDTDQLRKAATKLRADVAKRLHKAADGPFPDVGFDDYTGQAPYQEAAAAWMAEVKIIENAAYELADALERTAADYDRSDATAAKRLTAPR